MITNLEEEKNNFNVLQDKPLEDKDGDHFGHPDIAESLIKIIKRAPIPFSVGIYGQWGVGKSTICKIIQAELEEVEEYKVVYFDTWKYERDSFRRQFLITLDEKLNLGLDFKNKLNQSLTEIDPTRGPIKFHKDLLINQLGALGIIIIILGLACLLNDSLKNFSSVITSTGLLLYIIQLIGKSFVSIQTSFTKGKPDSAEGFEDQFIEVLKQVQDKKLVIIIDNLDRLSSEKAIALLSDIKTFLSDERYHLVEGAVNNRIIYLIPCDNKAVNKQLKKEYGKNFDAEEYLRKFFNHSIQIPRFVNIDLDNLIIEKLNQTRIEEFSNNYDLVFILTYAFRNNPREIIQFINSLISLYLLAKERKIDHVITKDNIAFLAKVLVLRVKWPHLYDDIEEQVLFTTNKLEDIVLSLRQNDEAKQKDSEDDIEKLQTFIENTTNIKDDEYQEIYFTLRQSLAQRQVPEWNSFILSLFNGNIENAEKTYTEVKANGKLEQLSQLLYNYCKHHKENDNLLFNILISFLKVIKLEDIESFQSTVYILLSKIPSQLIPTLIDRIDFTSLFSKGLEGISLSNKRYFSQKLIEVIRLNVSVENIIREKVKLVKVLFEITQSKENKSNFEFLVDNIAEVKRVFVSNLKYQELFPELEKESLFREDVLNDIFEILNKLGPLTMTHYDAGLTFISGLLQWSPIVENQNIRYKVLERSLEFFSKLMPTAPPSDEARKQALLVYINRVIAFYKEDKSEKERIICIKILQMFKKIGVDSPELETVIDNYIIERKYKSESIIDTLGKKFLCDDKEARSALVVRSGNTIDVLEELPLKKKLELYEKVHIINNLLPNPEEALKFLDYVDFKLPVEIDNNSNFRKDLVHRMIGTISAENFSEEVLEKWLDSIIRLDIDSHNTSFLSEKLKEIKLKSEAFTKFIIKFVKKNRNYFEDQVIRELTS